MTGEQTETPFRGVIRCETAFFLSVLTTVALGVVGAAAVLLAAAAGHRSRRVGTAAAWCVLAGVAAAMAALVLWHCRWNAIPETPSAGRFTVEVTDRTLGGEMPGAASRLLRGRLLRCEPAGEAGAACDEAIVFRLPGGMLPPEYGSRIVCTGVLRPGSGTLVRFLAVRGCRRILRVDAVRSTEPPRPGIGSWLEAGRRKCAGFILRGVDSDRVRALAGAMIFGAAGGVSRELRASFTGSGTVHLFSISGMHVAMLAALLSWLCRPLPLRLRFCCVVLLLAAAVVATGANTPALRAFWMIAVWSLLRAFCHWTGALNVMLLTGAVMLLLQPALAVDPGAQYSFVITALLLVLAERYRAERPLREAVLKLMPASALQRRRQFLLRLRSRCRSAFAGSAAAFCGSTVIGAAAQGIIPLGAIPANLLLTLLLPLLAAAVLVKAVLTAAGLAGLGAPVLSAAFELLYAVAAVAETLFGSIVPASLPWLGAVSGLVLLFVAVGAGRFRLRFAALTLLVCSGAVWLTVFRLEPPRLVVIAHDSVTPPVILLTDPGDASALMLNAPDPVLVRHAVRLLRDRGIGRLRLLGFTAARRRYAAAAEQLSGQLAVERVLLPSGDPHSGSFFADAEELIRCGGWCVPGENADFFKNFAYKDEIRLEYCARGSTLSFVLDLQRTGCGWRPVLHRAGAAPDAGPVFAWSNRITEWSHEFR